MTRASSLGQMGGRGLRRPSEHAVHRIPKRARRIVGCPAAAPGTISPDGVRDRLRRLPCLIELAELGAEAALKLTVSRVGVPDGLPSANSDQELLRRLGLGIARAIFEAAGGTLTAESGVEGLSVQVRILRKQERSEERSEERSKEGQSGAVG